jgi:hypothetical protein
MTVKIRYVVAWLSRFVVSLPGTEREEKTCFERNRRSC